MKTGIRNQESEVRSQESGDRKQESAIGAWHPATRSVLECGSPLPLFPGQRPASASPQSAGVAALVRARLISLGRFASWRIQSKVNRRLATAATVAVLFATCAAHAQPFAIDWYTIDGGGGMSTNTQYTVSGTVGQPDAAKSSGGSYTLEGGFWSIVAAIQTPGAPLLKVRRVGNTVEISWAAAGTTAFVLEETGSLAGTINWTGVATSPTVMNNENVVTVPASTGYRFFRLRKP